jgi:hypothetical protein
MNQCLPAGQIPLDTCIELCFPCSHPCCMSLPASMLCLGIDQWLSASQCSFWLLRPGTFFQRCSEAGLTWGPSELTQECCFGVQREHPHDSDHSVDWVQQCRAVHGTCLAPTTGVLSCNRCCPPSVTLIGACVQPASWRPCCASLMQGYARSSA